MTGATVATAGAAVSAVVSDTVAAGGMGAAVAAIGGAWRECQSGVTPIASKTNCCSGVMLRPVMARFFLTPARLRAHLQAKGNTLDVAQFLDNLDFDINHGQADC